MGAPCAIAEPEPGSYAVWYRHGETWLTFEQVRRYGGSFEADVTVTCPTLPMPAYRDRIHLHSAAAQLKLAQACNDLLALGVPIWRQRVASSCWLVVDRLRQGATPVELREEVDPGTRWLVDRWVPWGLPTVIYGDGGSGKSMLALALAVCARTGQALGGDPNWRVTPCESVLLLDWESDRQDHQRRVRGLAAGMGVAYPTGIWHVPMRGALADQVGPITSRIARGGIDLVIIDSIAPACAAELEASETAIRFFEAVARLGATALCIGHVNKAQAREGQAKAQIFGSVQFRNQTRSSFQVVAEETDGETEVIPVTFRLDKHNLVPPPYPPPIGWGFAYAADAIRITPAAASDDARSLMARMIEAFIAKGEATPSAIAETTATTPETIRKLLSRLSKRDTGRYQPRQVGKDGKETIWTLDVTKRDTPISHPRHFSEPEEPPF